MDISKLDTSHAQHLSVVTVESGAIYVGEIHNVNVADTTEAAQKIKAKLAEAAPKLAAINASKGSQAEEPDYSQSPFALKYVNNPEKRQVVMATLHKLISSKDKPKLKMLPLRAAIEAGAISGNISYQDFFEEFGSVKMSSYYVWMNQKTYLQEEIDPIIGVFVNL